MNVQQCTETCCRTLLNSTISNTVGSYHSLLHLQITDVRSSSHGQSVSRNLFKLPAYTTVRTMFLMPQQSPRHLPWVTIPMHLRLLRSLHKLRVLRKRLSLLQMAFIYLRPCVLGRSVVRNDTREPRCLLLVAFRRSR